MFLKYNICVLFIILCLVFKSVWFVVGNKEIFVEENKWINKWLEYLKISCENFVRMWKDE